MKKAIIIVGVCLTLLVAALGCGGSKDTHKMDMKIGVSALVALADNHIASYVNLMETLAMTQEVQSGDWDEMVGLLSKVEQSQVHGLIWFVLPDGSYFTVESDIKSAHLDCYLVVVDTSGISVESAVAGRYLTPETIATAMNESGVREKVGHHTLILPGLAARLSGEVEEVTGWRVLVGSKDSSGIPSFIKEHWPPDEATD